MDRYLKEFKEVYLPGRLLKDTTIRNYLQTLGDLKRFVNKPSEGITRTDIDEWVVSFRQRGVSKNVVCGHLAGLKQFVYFLIDRVENIDKTELNRLFKDLDDPRRRKIKLEKKEKSNQPPISFEEISRLLNTIERKIKDRPSKKNYMRDKAIIAVFKSCGLRSFEIVKIKPSNIKGKILMVEGGKGGKDAPVDMSDSTVKDLARWISVGSIKENEAIFEMSTDNLRKLIKNWARKAGLDKMPKTHSFRHHMASYLNSKGFNSEQIRRQGRWANISTMGGYLHDKLPAGSLNKVGL